MRTCNVAVIGLGLMGSAALYALARRGIDVIGFDPLSIGMSKRSSHGSCRVFRRFNFESEAYTALSDQAFRGWRALESASGRSILKPVSVLEAGPRGSPEVAASREAARKVGTITGPTSGAEANAAFPAFRLPDHWDVVVHESGGILMAEAALRAFREGAASQVVEQQARFEPRPAGIRIFTETEEYEAEKVIVAAGPWITNHVAGLQNHVTVTRQFVGWWKPARPDLVTMNNFPIFIIHAPNGAFYGFPDFEGRGVKAAQHDLGDIVSPDDWNSDFDERELSPVSEVLHSYIPGAIGPILERDVCLYTNTVAADAVPDAGGEFIIDRLPDDPRVIVASPCSGHGAKFATAIGEMLADLAVDPRFEPHPAFRLSRFSAFA